MKQKYDLVGTSPTTDGIVQVHTAVWDTLFVMILLAQMENSAVKEFLGYMEEIVHQDIYPNLPKQL